MLSQEFKDLKGEAYQQPALKVIQLQMHRSILEGSDPTVTNGFDDHIQ